MGLLSSRVQRNNFPWEQPVFGQWTSHLLCAVLDGASGNNLAMSTLYSPKPTLLLSSLHFLKLVIVIVFP